MRAEPTAAEHVAARALAQWNLIRFGIPLFCGNISLTVLYGVLSTVEPGWIVGVVFLLASMVLQVVGWSKELRASQETPAQVHGGVKWILAAGACLLLGIFLPVGLV